VQRLQDALAEVAKEAAPPQALTLQAVLSDLFKELESAEDVLPTGFADLDSCIRGLPIGTLTLIAGRPSMGKSATGLNVAYNLALRGVPCLYVGLEDRPTQHVKRLLAIDSGISLSDMVLDIIRQDAGALQARLAQSAVRLSSLPIHWLEAPQTASQICAVAKRYIQEHGVKAVFVDHVQELHTDDEDRSDQRTYEIQASAQKLRDLAVQTKTAVILAAQINREAEKAGRPTMAHLRDSGALEMVARLVLLLYRDEYYNEDTDKPGIIEVIVGKNNHGPSGQTIPLRWIGTRCKVADPSSREE